MRFEMGIRTPSGTKNVENTGGAGQLEYGAAALDVDEVLELCFVCEVEMRPFRKADHKQMLELRLDKSLGIWRAV